MAESGEHSAVSVDPSVMGRYSRVEEPENRQRGRTNARRHVVIWIGKVRSW